ncbi:dethiobiotin synthase [Aliikangiella sp. IMCC44632]
MSQKFFITGTDTEVGKTLFSCALIRALRAKQHTVMAFKPIAAGCETIAGEPKNEDALAIIKALEFSGEYAQVNPIALHQPIAPHIAAALEDKVLSVEKLQQLIDLDNQSAQFTLVEGAGGWLVPLNHQETMADYVVAEKIPVILVVGLKLGCINHALLTAAMIRQQGLTLAGWVANYIDPNMLNQSQNIETLKQSLECPLVAEIPFLAGADKIEAAANCVKLETIVG